MTPPEKSARKTAKWAERYLNRRQEVPELSEAELALHCDTLAALGRASMGGFVLGVNLSQDVNSFLSARARRKFVRAYESQFSEERRGAESIASGRSTEEEVAELALAVLDIESFTADSLQTP